MTLLMMAMGIINCGVSDCIYLQFHCKHNILSLSVLCVCVCVCVFQLVILMMPPFIVLAEGSLSVGF